MMNIEELEAEKTQMITRAMALEIEWPYRAVEWYQKAAKLEYQIYEDLKNNKNTEYLIHLVSYISLVYKCREYQKTLDLLKEHDSVIRDFWCKEIEAMKTHCKRVLKLRRKDYT